MMHILLAATAMLALISVSAVAADSSGTEATHMVCTDPKKTSADAIYLGGATIIGLAAFGSALGTGVVTGKVKKVESRGAYLIAIGAISVTISQGFIMWYACCASSQLLYFLLLYLFFTAGGAASIIYGFITIMSGQFWKDSKDPDNGQSPAQCGASTELHFRFKSGQGTGDVSFNHSGGKS